MVARRQALAGGVAIAMLGLAPARAREDKAMFGLIGKMRAQPGKRADLIAILIEGTSAMPGCQSYIVAEDLEDADAISITEVWDDADSHAASLKLPAVQAAIARGRPMIAGFDSQVKTRVVGGAGL